MRVLVDTSVWIDHFRQDSPRLRERLEAEQVATHPFVIGELACGNLGRRKEILSHLHALPTVSRAEDDEILLLIEPHGLAGRGLGLIDMHLLASSRLGGHPLWTHDRRLRAAARDLGVDFGP